MPDIKTLLFWKEIIIFFFTRNIIGSQTVNAEEIVSVLQYLTLWCESENWTSVSCD